MPPPTQGLCPDPDCGRPAGHPDAELTCDVWLTTEQAATRTGMSPSDLRARVSRGTAPAPDDPDTGVQATRRNPRWKGSTIDTWSLVRRSRGRPAADAAPFVVAELPGPRPWCVVRVHDGKVMARLGALARAEIRAANLSRQLDAETERTELEAEIDG